MQGSSGRCLVLGLLMAFPIQVGVWQPVAAQVLITQGEETEAEKADQLFDKGLELFQQQTLEGYRQALQKWQKALEINKKLGRQAETALMLLSIVRVYSDLGEQEKALDYLKQALPLWRSRWRSHYPQQYWRGLLRFRGEGKSVRVL